MISLLALFVCAFVVSYILTPICRDVALRAGLVDSPDQKRKLHAHPIPRVGGVPIMAACLFSVLVLVVCGSAAGGMVVRALPSIARLFPAVLVIFAVGLLDDLIALKPRYKLAGQLVAAGLACSRGTACSPRRSRPSRSSSWSECSRSWPRARRRFSRSSSRRTTSRRARAPSGTAS